jgi:hypothetical protein
MCPYLGFSQALRARRLRTALLAAPERTDQRLRGVEDAARAYASGTVTRPHALTGKQMPAIHIHRPSPHLKTSIQMYCQHRMLGRMCKN